MPYPYGVLIQTNKKYYQHGETVHIYAQPLGAWIDGVPLTVQVLDIHSRILFSKSYTKPNYNGYAVDVDLPVGFFTGKVTPDFEARMDYDGSPASTNFAYYY